MYFSKPVLIIFELNSNHTVFVLSNRLAYFISVVLHPLLMPTFLFGLLFFLAPTSVGVEALTFTGKSYLLGFLFVYTFLLPAMSVYWLKRMGIVKSLHLEERSERPLPLFMTTIIYCIMAYLIREKGLLLSNVSFMLVCIGAVIFMVGVISFFWQISAHAAGIGGVLGSVMSIASIFAEEALFYPSLLICVLAGLVISARLQLNAHTPSQSIAGFLLGFFVSIGAVFWNYA